jgi:hypothetical protein
MTIKPDQLRKVVGLTQIADMNMLYAAASGNNLSALADSF